MPNKKNGKEHQLLQQNIAQAQTAENQLSQKLSDLQQLIQNQKNTLQENLRQLDARKNEFTLTKSLVDSLEGFPESIKYLSKTKILGRPATSLHFCPTSFRVLTPTKPLWKHFLPFISTTLWLPTSKKHKMPFNFTTTRKKGKSSFLY
ncbi:MAG: hypothetical protein H6554_09710 [Chitinophagales bacterium]|nr:hypothetical protein [Chitinophagales bacterium]